MSLLDDMEAVRPSSGPTCSVKIILESLSEEDRRDVETALANPRIYGSVIAKILRDKRDIPITDDVLRYHRRGECKCHRS